MICPAGADVAADGQGSVGAIKVAIDPGQFSLAAAEGSAFEAELIERLSGHDQALFDLAQPGGGMRRRLSQRAAFLER
jgi:hypothetical protein